MKQVNIKLKELFQKRDKLRKQGLFDKADKIRKQIEDLGFIVADDSNQTIIKEKLEYKKENNSTFLTIFGGGEISSQGRQIHEYIFKKINKNPISITLITTPAGFQPNVQRVYEEIGQFFESHLTNFHPRVKILYANSLNEANDQQIVQQLNDTDYIFIGPGSPTYAVNHLKNTLLFKAIIEKMKTGTSLALSSAGAIAFSRFCLPVYEIYKVGEPLHWIDGLNFYTHFYKKLTAVPHFDNNEGGKKNDTSCCWMGKTRFKALRSLLPNDEAVIGIDEHTALIIDAKNQKEITIGKGSSHLL